MATKSITHPKLLPPIAGNLLGRFRIRRATYSDVTTCDRIARAYKSELGFVRRDNLTKSASKGLLHVAEIDGIVRGFVEFNQPTRGANKGYSVVYHLATERGWSGYGIGRNLLYSVPAPIRLKCTVDNTTANAFYAGAGMRLVSTEPGRKRALHLWELKRLIIFCAGGNVDYPLLARASRQAYGIRSDYEAFDYPFMLDAPFKAEDWNWTKHIRAVNVYRPLAALVRDYGEYDGIIVTKTEMLKQVQALRDCGVMRIFVCPKSHGLIDDIPQDCGIAISVQSSYAGFLPDFRDLKGRYVHLLGGTPQQWLDLIPKIEAHGAQVISCDGSSHESASKMGSHWDWQTHKWHRAYGKKAEYHNTIAISGRYVVRIMNAADNQRQLLLWAA